MLRIASAASACVLASSVAVAAERRPPGAEGDGRCTVYDAGLASGRDVVIHAGPRRRSFAICIDGADAQRVRVTLDRKRTLTVSGSAARRVCEDVEARHIRIEIERPGPTVSSCPAL